MNSISPITSSHQLQLSFDETEVKPNKKIERSLKQFSDFFREVDLQLTEAEWLCLGAMLKEYPVLIANTIPRFIGVCIMGDLSHLTNWIPVGKKGVFSKFLNDSFVCDYYQFCFYLESKDLDCASFLNNFQQKLKGLKLGGKSLLYMMGADPRSEVVRCFMQRVDLLLKMTEIKTGLELLFLKSPFDKIEEPKKIFPNLPEILDRKAADLVQIINEHREMGSFQQKIHSLLAMIDFAVAYFKTIHFIAESPVPILMDLSSQIKRLDPNRPNIYQIIAKMNPYLQKFMKQDEENNRFVIDFTQNPRIVVEANSNFLKLYQGLDPQLDPFQKQEQFIKILTINIHAAELILTHFRRVKMCLGELLLSSETHVRNCKFRLALAKYLHIFDYIKEDELDSEFRKILESFEKKNPNFRKEVEKVIESYGIICFYEFCRSCRIRFSSNLFFLQLREINQKFSKIGYEVSKTDPAQAEKLRERYQKAALLFCNLIFVVKHIDRVKKGREGDLIGFKNLDILYLNFSGSDSKEEINSLPLVQSGRRQTFTEEKIPEPKIKVKTRGTPHELAHPPEVVTAPVNQPEEKLVQVHSIDRKQIMRELEEMGFAPFRQGARHLIYRGINGEQTAIPRHGKTLKRGTIAAIMRQLSTSTRR